MKELKSESILKIKTEKKIIVSWFVFVLVFILSFIIVSNVMKSKEPYNKYNDFLSDKQGFDVIFLGSSHTENFYDPMLLWKEYGITSYNFGNPFEPMNVTYWLAENAVKVHKPKVIVLDIMMVTDDEREVDINSRVHYALDAFPLSTTKIKAINDLNDTVNDKLDKIFTISTYHSRWDEIGEDKTIDYFVKGTLSYGNPRTMGVESFDDMQITDEVYELPSDNESVIYLNKLIDFCRSNSIELILVSNPYWVHDSRQKIANGIEIIAEENNIPFINYNKENSVIDKKIDLFNLEHVNASGMSKVTRDIGNYLIENYQLTDHRSEESYSHWNSDYNDYIQLKYESLWYVDSLFSTLMLLYDDDIRADIYINNEKDSDNEIMNHLIDNLSSNSIVSYESDVNFNIFISNENIDDETKNQLSIQNTPKACVIVKDNNTNEINLVKVFKGDTECNNIYTSIKPKYLFK